MYFIDNSGYLGILNIFNVGFILVIIDSVDYDGDVVMMVYDISFEYSKIIILVIGVGNGLLFIVDVDIIVGSSVFIDIDGICY